MSTFITLWEKGQSLDNVEIEADSYIRLSFSYAVEQEAQLIQYLSDGIIGKWFSYQGHSAYVDKVSYDTNTKKVYFYLVTIGTPAIIYVAIVGTVIALGLFYLSLVKIEKITHGNPALSVGFGVIPLVLLAIAVIVLIKTVKT